MQPALEPTSESEGHQQNYETIVVLDLKFAAGARCERYGEIQIHHTRGRFPKFVIPRSTILSEFRKAKDTGKSMIPVRRFDLKVLIAFAAGGAGTSNRRHWRVC
jgi:hypothetical protein